MKNLSLVIVKQVNDEQKLDAYKSYFILDTKSLVGFCSRVFVFSYLCVFGVIICVSAFNTTISRITNEKCVEGELNRC